ncbi:Binding partner of ACD11 1 [Diplonema papillatum]|nr:Binding partner of ACD11 1 [Diplonema papillatum]
MQGRSHSISRKFEEKRTIAASNISSSLTAAEVETFFSYCGEIEDMRLIADPRSPGNTVAVVMYKREEDAESAFMLQEAVLGGLEIDVAPVEVCARLTIGDISETIRNLVSRSKSPTATPRVSPRSEPHRSPWRKTSKQKKRAAVEKSGTEEQLTETLKKYKGYVQRMSKEQKVAAAGGLCLLAAGALHVGKAVASSSKKRKEQETRCLVAAYDHLFRHGPS